MKRIQLLFIGFAALLASVIVHGQGNQTSQSNQGSQASQNNWGEEIHVASEPYTPMAAGAIRVQSTEVQVPVTVRDSQGKAIGHLTVNDFMVFDSGKQQKISGFRIEQLAPPPAAPAQLTLEQAPAPVAPPPPRYIGFYFDDNNMETNDLTSARKAAEKFVDTSMEEGDKIAVFTSSATVTVPFTTDKPKIIAAMQQVVSHIRKAGYGAGSCPHIDPYQAWQIVLNGDVHSPAFDLALAEAIQCNCMVGGDASCPAQMANMVRVQAGVTLSLADDFALNTLGVLGDVIRYVGKMPGRRMLVMTSSGFFALSNQVQKQQDKMVDQALHAGIRINTLDAKGLSADWLGGTPGEGPPIVLGGAMQGYIDELASDTRSVSNDPLAFLAQGTGGTFFHNSNDLAGGVHQMVALPDVSYTIAFSPDDMKPDGAYHNLKVRLANNKGYRIDARPGYYAPNKASLAPADKLEKLNKEVMSSDEIHFVAAGVVTKSITLAIGESALHVEVHVDIRDLPFKKENGAHVERLIFITALFDDKNKFLSGVEGVMDMNLKDETLKSLDSTGASASVTLQAPPGNYTLRQVIQESVNGKISAFNTPVEIK